MMRPQKIFLVNLTAICLLMLVLICGSCKDIVEPDLGKKSVNLLSPANGYNSQSANITFWWEEVKYATQYHLQVVKPDFNNIQALMLDTNVTSNKFAYTFGSGAYQWRIRAENGSSQTAYVTRGFSVDSTLNLSGQAIVLVSPSDNFISNTYKQQFKWYPLSNADDYRFEMLSGTGTIYINATYTKDTLTYTFSGDGTYTWRVKGQNVQSSTPFTSRTITIDASAPNTPTLLLPNDQDSTTFSVGTKSKAAINLSWDRGTVSGSAITDSVLVYQVPATSNFLYKSTTSTIYSDSLPLGTYYWKIRSYDAAGNKSAYSVVRSFKVK
ncbi:MAG: hypothetical protein HYU69_05375 [Bacteroidetes bacterium]|nr:hypothetical protein [Bacteroidota bacterium]